MASLYKRKNSPFWWIKYRSKTTGETLQRSTGLRVGVGIDTRRAKQMEAEKTSEERKLGPQKPSERWEVWVPDFLRLYYANSPSTLKRTQIGWHTMQAFLELRGIHFPRALAREDCMAYVEWRKSGYPALGIRKCSHNTAKVELHFFSTVMGEAVSRGYAPFNPCRALKIPVMRVREKPEFTEEHVAYIRGKIAELPDGAAKDFLIISFEIGRYQGCRVSETYLNPMTDVDLTSGHERIRFNAKGRKTHVAPLHPKLIPLFEKLIADGKTETFPKLPSPSRNWCHFLRKIRMTEKLPGACFHSLRVTAATRLARSKQVKETDAMKYIGHASATVHRAYQRLRIDDLSECSKALD